MDVYSVALACLRRWFVFLPLLVIAGLVVRGAVQDSPPQYTAQASVLVLAPENIATLTTVQQQANPFVVVSGGSNTAVNSLAIALQGDAALQAVASQVPDVSFGATPLNRGPILSLSTTASTAAAAQRGLTAVQGVAVDQFKQLQQRAGAPDNTLLRLVPLQEASSGLVADYPSRTKTLLALSAAGLILAVLVTVVVDALLNTLARRRRRRELAEDLDPDRIGVQSQHSDRSAALP